MGNMGGPWKIIEGGGRGRKNQAGRGGKRPYWGKAFARGGRAGQKHKTKKPGNLNKGNKAPLGNSSKDSKNSGRSSERSHKEEEERRNRLIFEFPGKERGNFINWRGNRFWGGRPT